MTYLWKTVWPVEIAVHYPLGPVHAGIAIGAAMVLGLLTALALFAFRRYPYVTVGWLWDLLTLAPVSGNVQVDCHSMADRYTYIPLIGIFIVAAWGIPEQFSRVSGGSAMQRRPRWSPGSAENICISSVILFLTIPRGSLPAVFEDADTLREGDKLEIEYRDLYCYAEQK